MSKTVLRVKNLETFYGPVMAIRGVTLEVGKGQIVTILGSNGAGKTTILKTISGAIEPQKGSVEFDGEAITGMEPDKIARAGIRHVPEGREVFPFLTVRENLEVGAFSEPDRKQVQRQMDRVFDYDPLIREIQRLAEEMHYETQERFITRIVDECVRYNEIKSVEVFLRKSPVFGSSGELGVRLEIGESDLANLRTNR